MPPPEIASRLYEIIEAAEVSDNLSSLLPSLWSFMCHVRHTLNVASVEYRAVASRSLAASCHM